MYGFLADLVVVVHAGFVVFVAAGGVLVWRAPWVAWAHVPALVWGVAIEWSGAICPLTPLETRLRQLGGDAGYRGDFIDHYVTPILYPAGLTRELQIALGVGVLLFNLAVYSRWLYWQRLMRRRGT